jgi:hypothetical protein
MTIGIIYRDELKEYDFGSGHPFRGDRYQLFAQFLRDNLAGDNIYQILSADPANERDLLLICGKEYIEFTKEYYKAANLGLSYPGKFNDFHSMDNKPYGRPGKLEEAARLIIGQAKMACDMVQLAKFGKVVSIGGGMHHAKPSYGEGFCIYNDVAFCSLYLMQEYGLERILILDTYAHVLPEMQETAAERFDRLFTLKSAGSEAGLLPVQEQKSVAKMLPNVAKDCGIGGDLASKNGEPRRTRTSNRLIKSQLLCQLS